MRFLGMLVIGLFGCDDGGGGGGADGGTQETRPSPLEGNAETLVFSATYDKMSALVDGPGFSAAAVGDPSPFISSDATAPTDEGQLSSLWYETDRFEEVVGRARDRRVGVDADDGVGGRITQRIALALTLGAGAEGDGRSGALWQGRTVVRSLDLYFLLAVGVGLGERSAAGYDRALGVLWDANGAPHGIGARIAAADAACGTDHLAQIAATLGGVQADFAAELEATGLPDSLGRKVIEAGALPEYDAAMETVELHLTAGLGLAFITLLDGDIDAGTQAAALAAFEAIAARVRASEVSGVGTLTVLLDASEPSGVDADEIQRIVGEALGISCGN